MCLGKLLPYGVAEEPLDPSLSLFEFDDAARNVPMNERAAIAVKVEALLPDRRGDEHPWPEWAVERLPDQFWVRSGFLSGHRGAEWHREA